MKPLCNGTHSHACSTLEWAWRPVAVTLVVGGDEAQDVLVPQHDGLVDLSLSEPGALLPGGEDLHGHVASAPLPSPHLPEATLPYDLLQNDGPGHCALHKQGEACGGGRETASEHSPGAAQPL